VRGAQAEYGSGGLGVPLVATRPNDREQPAEPQDRFFPERLRAAATAVLHPDGSPAAGDWRRRPVTLVLHDPFAEREVLVGGRAVPLASDRTTPLAVQVAGSSLAALVRVGVRRPDINRADYGLYVVQPYRPGKIPVVLVHGFRSSVATWVQTLNHLQSDPVLSERYQFWLYLYPTGATLPALAAGLRTALREALDTFDPWGADPALGQMVLIGHSMGGILSKMLVQDSGTELWDAVFRVPYDELRAPPDVKERLAVRLFYRPEPYVRRVVFVATGHGGSRLASLFLGRLVQALIREPATLRRTVFPILWQNGLRVVAPGIRLRRLNGVGEMRPRDPVLRAIDRAGIDPSVPYHSVIPQLGLDGIDLPTDGVVPYWSSHLDGAESETITRGFHTSQDSPEVTAELKRILREHLAAIEGAK
jgi:pimeloyl-ACP methyl ester carboxylesterase